MEKCKKCSALESSSWESEFIRQRGVCEKCYLESKGLIEHNGYYVPWDYQNYCDVENDEHLDDEDFNDLNAELPKISWCSKTRKWKTEFKTSILSSTLGSNLPPEVLDLIWYFDTKKDIIDGMERTPYNKLILKDNHYILQESRDAEEVNKPLPKVSWCSKHKKWRIEFIGTNNEGNGNSDFVRYFNFKENILKSMEKE